MTGDCANPLDGSAQIIHLCRWIDGLNHCAFRTIASTTVNVRIAGDQELWECRRIAPTPGTCAKRNAE
jgi:hypothetical protein